MDFANRYVKNILWVLPAIVALLIALIPTLTYQWPLTVDIFYHIHIAQVYSLYGLTLTDPLIDPGMGYKIGYPPLFTLVLTFLVKALNLDYFQAAKLLQPFLAFSVVLSVSYVAKKFYGNIAGISAGFLILSSYLFGRLVAPLPETMALIFVPLVVYFYYKSVEDKKYLYALISGLIFVLVVLTHQATTLNLFLVISAAMLVLSILYRNVRFFTSYLVFLSVPLIIAGIMGFLVFLWAPDILKNIFVYGVTAVTGYITYLPVNIPIDNLKYVAQMGVLIVAFAIFGGYFAIKKKHSKYIIIIIWIVAVFIISKSYWFGINVYSYRLFVHLLLPLSILAGVGLSYVYTDFRKREFPSKSIRTFFLVTVFVLSSLYGIVTVENPKLGIFGQNNGDMGTIQIAPPSNSEVDLANWFSENGNKNYIALSNNYFTTQFLLAKTNQPIASFYRLSLWMSSYDESVINNASSGFYFIYDKRLTFNSTDNRTVLSVGNMVFFNNDTYNPKNVIPGNKRVVYENHDYIIFEKKF